MFCPVQPFLMLTLGAEEDGGGSKNESGDIDIFWLFSFTNKGICCYCSAHARVLQALFSTRVSQEFLEISSGRGQTVLRRLTH